VLLQVWKSAYYCCDVASHTVPLHIHQIKVLHCVLCYQRDMCNVPPDLLN
jgi:hypothetical protein